jgi:hypothetical protein
LAEEPGRPGIAKVNVTFTKPDPKRIRSRKTLVILLDESQGWMPVEVRAVEAGGDRIRQKISGWQQDNGIWIYDEIKAAFHPVSEPAEVLHNVSTWKIINADSVSREKECFLAYYGLPEPGSSSWTWKLLMLVGASTLLVLSYRWLTRKNATSRTK